MKYYSVRKKKIYTSKHKIYKFPTTLIQMIVTF